MSRILALIGLLAVTLAASADAVRYPAQPSSAAGMTCVSDAGLYCFRGIGGGLVWRALEGEHVLEPVVTASMVLVGTSTGVHAFDGLTGERRWRVATRGLAFTPTVAGDTAFAAAANGRFLAIDLDSGRVRWSRRFDGWSYPPAVLGDVLVTGGREGVLRGLDRATGAIRWQGDAGHELVYRPVAAGDRAIVTTFGGATAAVDAAGRRVWAFSTSVPSHPPAMGADVAYLAGMDGRIHARRRATGAPIWTHDTGTRLTHSGRVEGATLAVTTADGAALLVGLADGHVRRAAPVAGRIVGDPLRGPEGAWFVAVRRGGTIGWSRLSTGTSAGNGTGSGAAADGAGSSVRGPPGVAITGSGS